LLSDDEMSRGPEVWHQWVDPFEQFFDIGEDDEDEAHGHMH
jgi:hypothetical protein